MIGTRMSTVWALFLATASIGLAATPPDLVNYQGVLRNASDKPQTGSFDMVFRFFDAATAGNEILVDSHLGGGNVSVSNGLFNTQLGGGTVTDGTGAGTYTALSQVFRDYNAVWLEIKVGAETLSPRIRVQSAAYALNATNLGGQPAGSFVDTSGSSQTKAGHLIVNNGIDASTGSGFGINATGSQAGGSFGAGGAFAYVADTGVINTGIRASGNVAGGWFKNGSTGSEAYAAYGNTGVQASGASTGGYFVNSAGDYAYAGVSGSGIWASGSSVGGQFFSPGTGYAALAQGSYGINAAGTPGGYFAGRGGLGNAFVGTGDWGIQGYGNYPAAGGYFADPYHSGKAWAGFGDIGIYGIGAQTGGEFTQAYHNVYAFLGGSAGAYPTAVYAYSDETNAIPAEFDDYLYGSWAYPGYAGYKIAGNGTNGFIQNHPTDSNKVVVYSAPEGDEVAVYTRGSARLVNGEARVALGATFALVANPDIGLTATATANGELVPLTIIEKSTHDIVVRGPAGSNAAFDYMVWGLRIGFEDRAVVQKKQREAFLPSHRVEEDQYALAPELRQYSALSRFSRMHQTLGGSKEAVDLTASKALEAAIHVYDRATDGFDASHDAHSGRPRSVAAQTPPLPPPVPGADSIRAGEAVSPTGRIASELSGVASSLPPTSTLPANTVAVSVGEIVEAGDLLSNDPVHPGRLLRSRAAADRGVVGVVAGGQGAVWTEQAWLALPGTIVIVKVDASYGAIAANDLLVSSLTPGHAMRAERNPEQGTVIGKALESFDAGTGTIRVLVMSR